MTEFVRTAEQEAAYQHLVTAKDREAVRIKEAVEAFLTAHADLPFESRLNFQGRNEFLLPYFDHLVGIERAMVVSQAAFRISDRLWAAERERRETEDA